MLKWIRNSGNVPRVEHRQLISYMLIFVIVPVVTFTFGRWLDVTLSLPRYPPFPFNLIIGFSVFFSGLALGIKSTRLLYKVGLGLPWGGVRREAKTTRLVKTGPYAYTRNPMVLGYSMLPFGMGVMFRSMGMAIPITAVTLLVNIVLVKTREEPSLESRFGEEYCEYKRGTPFLIPDIMRLVSDIIGRLNSSQARNLDTKEPDA